jgi:hypothetical protein
MKKHVQRKHWQGLRANRRSHLIEGYLLSYPPFDEQLFSFVGEVLHARTREASIYSLLCVLTVDKTIWMLWHDSSHYMFAGQRWQDRPSRGLRVEGGSNLKSFSWPRRGMCCENWGFGRDDPVGYVVRHFRSRGCWKDAINIDIRRSQFHRVRSAQTSVTTVILM